jgi:hypothetical protein
MVKSNVALRDDGEYNTLFIGGTMDVGSVIGGLSLSIVALTSPSLIS